MCGCMLDEPELCVLQRFTLKPAQYSLVSNTGTELLVQNTQVVHQLVNLVKTGNDQTQEYTVVCLMNLCGASYSGLH